MKTMLDILKERLPEGVEVVKVKSKASASQSEVWFVYQGMEGKTWLSKTCAPGYENKICDQNIATLMLGFALQMKNLEMAEYWRDKMLNG